MKTRWKIYWTIVDYILDKDYAPTYKEIQKKLKIKSKNTINFHLKNLISKGLMYRTTDRFRNIRITKIDKP